jgi:hypothetical protein
MHMAPCRSSCIVYLVSPFFSKGVGELRTFALNLPHLDLIPPLRLAHPLFHGSASHLDIIFAHLLTSALLRVFVELDLPIRTRVDPLTDVKRSLYKLASVYAA